VWMSRWGLLRDPFAGSDSPYVSLPSHDEAVARLLFSIETSQRWSALAGSAGLGKSAVLRKVRLESHSPRRRFVSIVCPPDGDLLFSTLAECLGQSVGRAPSRASGWRGLERGVRLATLEGCQLVLAIDDCADPLEAKVRRDLETFSRLASAINTDLSIILMERSATGVHSAASDAWSIPIHLERLTRSQAEKLLAAKLEYAGNPDRIFTPRALTRLHALSRGVPRKLEQLAVLCLIGGASRGLEVIQADLVDAIAQRDATDALVSGR
jgi:type II secretory pathway predicted ATPase ExeA